MANKILPVAEALKQLYQSLGGDDPEVLELSTNTELIQEIAKIAPSGSGLPEVTEADDGRVLGVDDGEWKAVEPASPYDAIVYIYHSNNSADDYDITIEKGDFSALKAILDDNRVPHILVELWDDLSIIQGITSMVAVYTFDAGSILFRPKLPTVNTGDGTVGNSNVRGSMLAWHSDNSIQFTY